MANTTSPFTSDPNNMHNIHDDEQARQQANAILALVTIALLVIIGATIVYYYKTGNTQSDSFAVGDNSSNPANPAVTNGNAMQNTNPDASGTTTAPSSPSTDNTGNATTPTGTY